MHSKVIPLCKVICMLLKILLHLIIYHGHLSSCPTLLLVFSTLSKALLPAHESWIMISRLLDHTYTFMHPSANTQAASDFFPLGLLEKYSQYIMIHPSSSDSLGDWNGGKSRRMLKVPESETE